MSLALTNTPSTFQSLMNDIFQDFLRKFVLVFFDDILIYSSTTKIKKCVFGQTRIDYLRHVIDSHGVSVDPSKIQAIIDWPAPSNLRGLHGFLGLTGYYRKFVRNYSSLAWPPTQQLKKDAFHWDEEADRVFQRLKKVMTSLPVLALPDFS